MPKLKNTLITWLDGQVMLVPKKDGPGECDGYIDPAEWDQSDLTLLFLNWFSMFAIEEYRPMRHLGEVYYRLTGFDEFEKFNNVVLHSQKTVGGAHRTCAA